VLGIVPGIMGRKLFPRCRPGVVLHLCSGVWFPPLQPSPYIELGAGFGFGGWEGVPYARWGDWRSAYFPREAPTSSFVSRKDLDDFRAELAR
jgi:hypothetical protein